MNDATNVASQRSILVTGGSRGIGRAIVQRFASNGHRVCFSWRSNAAAAASTLESIGGAPHRSAQSDTADPEQTRALVESMVRGMDGIDVLVLNAGIYQPHPIAGIDYDGWQQAWDAIIRTNLIGPANLCYLAAQAMIEQGRGGSIVMISSRGAFRGEPDFPAYGASKAGLNGLGQSLAIALAKYDISVGIVAPGYVRTDMVDPLMDGPAGDAIRAQSPFHRIAEPDEVARAVEYLADPGNRFVSGTIIDVNGASYLRS